MGGGTTRTPGIASRPVGVANGTVLDPSGSFHERPLYVDDAGSIAAGPGPGSGLLDGSGAIVLPGFVDTHEHLRSFTPGSRANEGQSLPDLLASAARASAAATAEDYRALTALASARLARAGVTSAIDQVYPLHRPGMLRAAIAGHEQVGVRTNVAVGIMTEVPSEVRSTPDEIFRLIADVADDALPADRLFVAPVSLRQASLDAYRAAVEHAVTHGLRLYTHISESTDEVERCLAENGVRPVQLLERLGFLRPQTVLVHCVHLDDADIAAIAASGASVVYCPTNHLWLAKGIAPVRDLLSAGVTVCLGLDGMGDPFTEVREAMFVQGLAAHDPGALSTDAAYRLATAGGAAAFAAAGVTGTLHVGGPADFITVATREPALQPVTDPLFSLVRYASRADVVDVVVGGTPIVRRGRLVSADEDELVDDAWRALIGIADRAGAPAPADWRRNRLPRAHHPGMPYSPRD